MNFSIIFKKYLNQLELIAEEHDELTDTDVRERLHEVINWYFIWGNKIDEKFPKRYSMFTKNGDKAVAKTTFEFIKLACQVAKDVKIGEDRHNLIERSGVKTKSGEEYDLYLGSSDEVIPPQEPTSDNIFSDYDED